MNVKYLFIIGYVMLAFCTTYAQKSPKLANYFGEPMAVDSSSTIIIPTLYNTDIVSSNKIALWGDYYSNIVFYNFITDSSRKLFDKDTFIVGFDYPANSYRYQSKPKNNFRSVQWIFYRVKNTDRNKNGRIDNKDPAILFVSDIHGEGLKPLTSVDENVLAIEIFEKQNFALVKIQRDYNNDGNFETDDKDFYYIKLDLTSLTFGKKIELK